MSSPAHTSRLTEEQKIAQRTGLVYVTDSIPDIRRVKSGHGFKYVTSHGNTIRSRKILDRIQALVIPPAWTDVWISPHPRGHLQATGRDARGRKQYRYHHRWRTVRDDAKFDNIIPFARALPMLRRRVATDLRRRGLCREKVLATIFRLLETTLIRIGNEEYARTNNSYGLTTLHNRHVSVGQARLQFSFRGKSGVFHEITVEDSRLAYIVRKCRELPGQYLFQYVDERHHRHRIGSTDVNRYLQEVTGRDFTAKDFRTWAATLLMVEALATSSDSRTNPRNGRVVNDAVKQVAQRLGNTAAVCRKCYIHPAIITGFLQNSLPLDRLPASRRRFTPRISLSPREKAVIRSIRRVL